MSINALYNVISEFSKSKKNIPGVTDLSLRTPKKGKQYFFFELPVEQEITIGEYKLIKHHLSVYEGPMSRLDMKSQYHYTAYFKDTSGKEYRLHLYYDAQDNYLGNPLLSIAKEDDNFEPIPCQEYHEAFKLLADQKINGLVQYLRRAQRKEVEKLQTQYEKLEEQATTLSSDLVNNKKEYLLVIQSEIEVLGKLKSYSNDPRKVLGLIAFAKNIKQFLELQKSVPAVPKVIVSSRGVTDENTSNQKKRKQKQHASSTLSSSSSTSESSSVTKTKMKSSRAVKEKKALDNIMAPLKLRLEQLKEMDDALLINEISVFLGELVLKECALEKNDYNASVKAICDLRLLRTQIEELIKNLLIRLLMKEQFDQAINLRAFYYTLPDTMMPYALTQNKSELIDFLLKHKIVPLNYKNFIIKEVDYNSLLDFYFRKTSKEQSLMIKSVEVLIKNGSSLMEIDRRTGLPFAAMILLDTEHPFRVAFQRNANLTFNNPLFYKQLNQVLQVIVAQPGLLKEKKKQINKLILQNTNKISLLAIEMPSEEISYAQLSDELTTHLKSILGEEFTERVLNDPEIVSLGSLVNERFASLLKKFSRAQKTDIVQNAKEYFDGIKGHFADLKEQLNLIEDLDLRPLFEGVKKEVIKDKLDSLNFINLIEELLEVQRELENMPFFNSKEKRYYNQRLNRLNELMIELNSYQKAQKESEVNLEKLKGSLAESNNETSAPQTSLSSLEDNVDTLIGVKKAEVETDKVENMGLETNASNGKEIISYFGQQSVKTFFNKNSISSPEPLPEKKSAMLNQAG